MMSFLKEAVAYPHLLQQVEIYVHPQKRLPDGVLQAMKQELHSPKLAESCLRTCELVMNYLRTAGGDPALPLVAYAQAVLRIDCTDQDNGLHFGFLRADNPRSQSGEEDHVVCLAHMNDLFNSLSKLALASGGSDFDDFATLVIKYRAQLPIGLDTSFHNYFKSLQKETQTALANSVESFVREFLLGEETMDAKAGAKQYLEPLLTNNSYRDSMSMEPLASAVLEDFSRTMQFFPNDLHVEHCFGALQLVCKWRGLK